MTRTALPPPHILRRAVLYAPEAKSPARHLWQLLHRAARSGEPEVRRRFIEAVRKLRAGIDLSALEAALEAGNADAAMRAIPWEVFDAEFGEVAARIEALHARGARVARAELSADLGGVTLRFDLLNERSVEFARTHAAQLVREVGDETRRAIRGIIIRGFEEGIAPAEMRSMIYGRVGLTQRQQQAVRNFRARLEEAGLTGVRLDRRVSTYVGQSIRRRSMNIARTETLRAAHAGTQDLWTEAVRLGYLPENTKRIWILTPDDRLCPYCEAMEGQVVGMDEDFTSPLNGVSTLYPPLHPSCRCSMATVSP